MTHAECQVWSFACSLQTKIQRNCILFNSGFSTCREEAVLNDCDCALFELSNKVIATAATNIRRAVSFVHQCSATCHFEEGPTPVQIEREQMSQTMLHFMHDFSNKMYCYNRYCILPTSLSRSYLHPLLIQGYQYWYRVEQ